MGEELIKKFNASIFPASDYSLESLIKDREIPGNTSIIDTIDISLKELYEVYHPERKDLFDNDEYEEFLKNQNIDTKIYGNWVYYEWRNSLIKIPPKDHFQLLRTARNQLLITPENQSVLFTKTILIAGMSVGSNVVEQVVHGGIAGNLILADMDTLELTNLNRIKTGILDIGLQKVVSSARKALEVDPYLNIYLIDSGINEDSLKSIKELNVDLIVDEVDEINAKILLRKKAKELKVPLLMATDNSDGALIDVERYDIDVETVMFNNRIPDEILQAMVSGDMPREQAGAVIGKYFVGFDIVDNYLINSLREVRVKIPSWPQLGTAASMSGILVAYCSKIIMLGGKLNDNRYICSFDKDYNEVFSSYDYKNNRRDLLSSLES